MTSDRPNEIDVLNKTSEFSSNELNIEPIDLPDELYLLPLSERPFFPPQTLPVLMNESSWLETLRLINKSKPTYAGLILTHSDDQDNTCSDDFYYVGTIVRLHHPVRASGKIQFIAEGLTRFRIREWLSDSAPYKVRVTYPKDREVGDKELLKAYAIAIINTLKELVPLNPMYSEELKFFLKRFEPNDPGPLTDFAASLTSSSKEELQSIIETTNLRKRMERVVHMIKKEVEVIKLQAKIRQEVEEKLSDHQRKFFLREQLKAIQKELGIAKDDRTADRERFEERLTHLTLSEAAQIRIEEELDKMSILELGSPEYAVTRNYLDIITGLPWGVTSKDKLNPPAARKLLNKDHEGLDEVKDRIVEFIAVGALRGEISGSIILLVGPPGVGKTSIGRSIANALGRQFFRFSVGGMRDEAEIKGHRRTYIGAMPGKIIQALKDTGTANPVIMLDEIDKLSQSYQGDPASALLEVLDPEQNHAFLDHYLDLRFDLSKILFVCTANQLDTIPRPLLDRMEVLRLSGYITAEKIKISKRHLLPRLLKKAGIKRRQFTITEPAIRMLIDLYAREAGVRNLEKQLNRIIRKTAVKMVNQRDRVTRISTRVLSDYLGQPVFHDDLPISAEGVVTGLAWTALGGATLCIESCLIHSERKGFKLTGNLGDVMKESAQIAYSYISSHLKDFGAQASFFDNAFLHIHVPEGATPKDGPSAGVTMATALLSLALAKVPAKIAMTGELTLTGNVLAVGGIREKVVAAKRAGLREIILPEQVKGEYLELPKYVREDLKIHFVNHYEQVVDIMF